MNLLDLLYIPIGLVTAPFTMRKKRSGWDQRLGHVGSMLRASGQGQTGRKRILLHAVSVGEVNALRRLVPMLGERADVIVSVTTDTGLQQAQSLFGGIEHCQVVRYPLDCSWMVRRFLDHVEPDAVGLVELEVWPNFIRACAKREIPIGIINGRLSTRSFRGYRKARFLLHRTFARLGFACVQDQAYATRIRAMGVDEDRVRVTGSMKWDSVAVVPDDFGHDPSGGRADGPCAKAIEVADAMGIDRSKPIVVAGSTGPGEEAMLDGALADDVQLVMAPRKSERFVEAGQAVSGCVRRSKGEKRAGARRFMLDTIGELSAVYELADVVIIGRSFFDLYGSDPVEPAAMGKAVLIGPAYTDFLQAMGVLLEADAIQVVDSQGVGDVVLELLRDTDRRLAMGQRARACVLGQQGASEKHRDVLFEAVGIKNRGNA